MAGKRTLVLVSSLVIGAGLSLAIIYLGFQTTLQKFAYTNVALLVLSLSCLVGIWLDYFMGTNILKE